MTKTFLVRKKIYNFDGSVPTESLETRVERKLKNNLPTDIRNYSFNSIMFNLSLDNLLNIERLPFKDINPYPEHIPESSIEFGSSYNDDESIEHFINFEKDEDGSKYFTIYSKKN